MPCPVQVKVSPETKKKLDDAKEYPRETYDDVISKLIKLNNNALERLQQ